MGPLESLSKVLKNNKKYPKYRYIFPKVILSPSIPSLPTQGSSYCTYGAPGAPTILEPLVIMEPRQSQENQIDPKILFFNGAVYG